MSSFEDTLARMKGLIKYGNELNESSNLKTHTLEHRAVAADGITYGIIRENSKYYIKSAPKGKETIAEAYNYLGGFCNKGSYEYNSYAKALKQFELKLASINEAHDQKVNIESLNPFRMNKVLQEGTDAMRDEIARQRQIMYNVSMLMNESTEIGAGRKDDVVKYDGKNPEAETGKKGDEGGKKATAQPEYKGSKTNGVDKKAAPFNQNASASKDQLKEDAGDIGDAPLHSNTENWGTEGIGKGRDPKQVGWEMDGQKTVNEEENDWASKGLPSSPGVGEADTDHNNDPFNKGVNESEEFDDESDVEGGELGGEDAPDVEGSEMGDTDFEGSEDAAEFGGDSDDMSTDTDFDAGVEDEDGLGDEDGLDADLDAEDDEFADDDMGDDLGGDINSEGGNEDLLAQIEDLQSQIDALRAQLEGGEGAGDLAGEEPEFEGDAESFVDDGDDLGDDADFDDEEDFGDEEGGDFSDEEDFDGEGMGDDEFGGDDFDGEGMGDESDDFDGGDEESFEDDDDLDECGMGGDPGMGMQNMPQMNESKRKIMNKIVESVVKQIVKEDELHVFGKHPGYRKKPMELPTTGEDKNQWGEDWNDESVHSEEPFGSKIGNGDPFNKLVDAVTKDVMYQLKAGIPIEGENKKKE